MKAIVLYDTRFGNTAKIARSLEEGLKKEVAETQEVVTVVFCTNVKDLPIDSLKHYDLICIGAPTEGFTASKPIKKFLKNLKAIDLAGKYGFAFDTKLDSKLSGSAAKFIEKELSNQGIKIILPHESAIVTTVKEKGSITDAILKEGEEKRYEQIGHRVQRLTIENLNRDRLVNGENVH